MARRLYVYYRVPEPQLAAVRVAVTALQAGLMQRLPGLQAGLLRRPELRDGEVTLMETYHGVDADSLQAALAEAVGALPQPRHSEWFDVLG